MGTNVAQERLFLAARGLVPDEPEKWFKEALVYPKGNYLISYTVCQFQIDISNFLLIERA